MLQKQKADEVKKQQQIEKMARRQKKLQKEIEMKAQGKETKQPKTLNLFEDNSISSSSESSDEDCDV